jgi:GAF domain-containing protein
LAEDRLTAAVAAGAFAGEEVHAALLRSIVDVARSIFAARAASITLLDEATDELVFEAVSGEGSESLLGTRFGASEGVAGWVVSARQPLVLDDVSADPRFSRRTAQQTGYVPKALMAVPLLRGELALGVLSVLDRTDDSSFGLAEMELLELFAHQAALALDIVRRARTAGRAIADEKGDVAALNRVALALEEAEPQRRKAALAMLEALGDLLSEPRLDLFET